MQPSETSEAIRALLHNLTIDCQPIRSRSDRQAFANAGHYAFALTKGRETYRGEYSVGVGILTRWAQTNGKPSNHPHGWDRSLFKNSGGRISLAAEEALRNVRAAYRPDVVDIVGSMLHNLCGMSPDCTFRDWLDDSGMDFKHPADALETFEAVKAEARFLRRVFDASTLETLQTLAHDL